jgi:uncharacterized protein
VLTALLFFGACLGHLMLMVVSHNWWYGQALSKRVGDAFHLAHGLLVAGFPPALYLGWGPNLAGLWDLSSAPWWQQALAGYVALCLVLAFVALPLNTVRRLLRREPVVESRSEVVDVARELGRRPAGVGKERWLTYLPGNGVFRVEFAERVLCPARLPAGWDGLTVLHLSDLHFNGTPDKEFFRYVMDRCAGWEPDLVALTGDVVDGDEYVRWIVPLLGRLRWKVAGFAILGNHDHWYDVGRIRRRLRRVGLRVPENGWEQVEVRGQPLVVIGHEGPWLRPGPELGGCPEGAFRLCLSHTPDNLGWARRNGVDLMLSGHVHGGQVRVPPFGSILVPSVYGRRYDCGTFDEAPTLLHVSRGLSGEHPLRYGCRPEVTRLVLRGPRG